MCIRDRAGLDLGSIVYPKYMTCDYIVQYVRALQNEAGNNIKTLYRILEDVYKRQSTACVLTPMRSSVIFRSVCSSAWRF